MDRQTKFLIPQICTAFRILLIPIMFYFAAKNNRSEFVVLFVIAGLTDALDGFLARMLGVSSSFGSKFDSWADKIFYYFLPVWFYFLAKDVLLDYWYLWLIIVLLGLAELFVGFIKFRKILSLHLWQSKMAAVATFLFAWYSVSYISNVWLVYCYFLIVVYASVVHINTALNLRRFS